MTDRLERALGLLVGTVLATGVFIVSFFVLFGQEAPSGMIPVLVIASVILALFPGIFAITCLVTSFNAVRRSHQSSLKTSLVVSRSIWSAVIINATFAALGTIASMGMLLSIVIPYLLVSSGILVALGGLLGWGASSLVVRALRPRTGS